MYSGGDSADAQSYNQWALNPTTYQNMSNEQVDWAALAQQWIIMKEAGPPVPEPTAIPQNSGKKVRKDTVEAGEAPMEVENDNDDPPQWNEGTGSGDSWKWQQNQQQQQWNWDNSWNNSPASAPKPPLLPTPSSYNQYSGNVDNASDNSNYGYNTPTSYQSGYWTASGSAKVIKPHNKRYSKVNVPTTVASTPSVPPKVVSLDAAKRKQLPAWIREGLEKMERDKLKQLDREREKQEKDENEAKRKLYEQNAMEILKDTVKEQQHVKSKFDSGSEESEDDIEGRSLTPEPQPAPPPRKLLNQEDMMVSVRRTMTEILLKVTNSEIYNICKEELERFQKKKKASEHRVSAPSGANLSAKLGLGAYGESDSENSEPDSNDNDSDAELKETIRRRKAEFVKIEKAIEEKLAASEKKEIVAVSGSRTDSPTNSDDKESQVDAKGSGLRRISHENSSAQHRSKISKRSSRKSDTSSDSRDSSKDRRSSRYSRRRSDSSSSSSRSRSRSRDHHHKSSSRSENRIGSDRSDRKYSTSDRKYPRRSSRSRSRRRRSESRSRSRSYRRSRSMSRSRRRSSSRSYSRRRRSGSRRRSDASSRRRRSRSYSSGRGKKSHRH